MLPSLAEKGGSRQTTAGLVRPDHPLPPPPTLLILAYLQEQNEYKQGDNIKLLTMASTPQKHLAPHNLKVSQLIYLKPQRNFWEKLSGKRALPPLTSSHTFHLNPSLGLSLLACFTKVGTSRKSTDSGGRVPGLNPLLLITCIVLSKSLHLSELVFSSVNLIMLASGTWKALINS